MINKQFMLKILRKAANSTEERKPGYRKELYNNLTNILIHEYEHEIDGGEITKKVTNEIDKLGDFLNKGS